ISSPSSRILPALGCSKPAIMRRVVVLPQPEGPSMEKNSPPGMCRLMPCTATTGPNRLTTSTTWTSPPPRTLPPLLLPLHVEAAHVLHHRPTALAGYPLAAGEESEQEVGQEQRADGEIDHDRRQRVDRGQRRRPRRAVD